jgi:hypothetical protein
VRICTGADVGTVNGSAMHPRPVPLIRVRSSVAPHLAPLCVSESTEVSADPWSPIDWTPFPWGALVGLAMAEPAQRGDPMRET